MLAESYRVLGVPFGAEMPQIRRAYRQLVLQYHPDRNQAPEAPAKFLQVQAAYEYLQRFQELGYAPATHQPAAPAPPPTPEEEWERYQYVYDPPANPQEYAAWARVGKERVRRQKEKDHAAYVRRTLAMKKQWWYNFARGASYLLLYAGRLLALAIAVLPLTLIISPRPHMALLALLLIPVAWRINQIMGTFREDIRKHFGEDLPSEAN